MRGAIDEAVAFIDRRIRKNKTRLARNLRPDALASTVPAEFDVVEEPEFDVVRTKRFRVDAMDVDESTNSKRWVRGGNAGGFDNTTRPNKLRTLNPSSRNTRSNTPFCSKQ